ncbi:hypothetical protein [Azospirillum sp.]|uniref:hypothetical protein n=1 Tax=Azospirillum sp. TaxID=34012 RepID=UPI002D6A3579|nr:hypothetical protein [Azospirillum sp.]HYF86190.1 hypothetical protein [Azospirillum sp.]
MDEHDVVKLVCQIEHEAGVLVPAGTHGTIVNRYPAEGKAVGYLLELRGHDPVALLDVAPTDVELVQSFRDLMPVQREIIRAALEPPTAIMTLTDDTTDEEFEVFLRDRTSPRLQPWLPYLHRRNAERRKK